MYRLICRLIALVVLATTSRTSLGQSDPQLEPPPGPAIATVTFTMNLGSANPPYYSIAITSIGGSSYRSIPNSDKRTGEPYMVEFEASSSTRTEIFRIAQELHFFKGKFKTSQVSHSRYGSKSLTFADGPITNGITYTSSKNPLINRLTALFESISVTMEFGRNLERLRTGDPSALAAELKQIERRSRHGRLAEFQVIAPMVQGIATDAEASKMSRRYARAILAENRPSRESKPVVSELRSPSLGEAEGAR